MAEETKKSQGAEIRAKVNQLFTKIGTLSKIQRLLICLGTFLVIGGGYYYFVFAPRYETLGAAKKELKTLENRLASYKIKARSLGKYEKKMAEVQEKFNVAMKALPDKKEVPALLTGISKAGTKAGLEFRLFQPEPVVNKAFYKEIPLSMAVTGSYHQVADFFSQVADLNRIVNIRDMSMTKDGKARGRVQMKCSAVTYMFAEPVEGTSKQGKKKKRRG